MYVCMYVCTNTQEYYCTIVQLVPVCHGHVPVLGSVNVNFSLRQMHWLYYRPHWTRYFPDGNTGRAKQWPQIILTRTQQATRSTFQACTTVAGCPGFLRLGLTDWLTDWQRVTEWVRNRATDQTRSKSPPVTTKRYSRCKIILLCFSS